MAETAELQEPPAWGEIVRDEVFQQAPAEEKNRIFDAWEQDNRAFAKTLGATDDELDAFHNDLRTRWGAQMATIGAGQTMDAATLPVRAAAAYAETPQGRAETAQGLEVEAENLRAQANVLEQEQEARGFGTQEPRKLRNQAADLRMRAAQINPQVLPLEQLGVNTPDDRVSPIRSFLGPAVSAQAESPMGRGLTSTLGGTAGGAIGAATFAAPFTGGTSLLMGLGGGLLGGAVGSSGQEVVMQAMEDPEQTAQRQQETARAAQESPGLFTVGRLLNTSAIFRPSLTETRAAIAGAPGARLNLAATAGIGAGVEGSAAAMRGEPVLPAALGGIMENVLFSRPTALGQRLGFRPSEFQPNPQTDTVRTPIGTIDPQGRIVEPGSPEGTALQALEGLHSVEPTTITPDAQQISQTSPPDGGMRPSQVPPQDVPLSTPERGEGVQPSRQGEGMAPAPPETAQPLTVQDIVPAIRVAGQVVRGNRDETHQDILNRLKTENPDAYAEALVDFDTKENPNFFVGPDDTPISREQLQQQFGVRDSQGLRDLQAKEPEAAPEPTGMRNAIVEAQRAARGLEPREAVGRRSFGQVWDEATAISERDPQAGSNLVRSLQDNMRPLEDTEDAVLTREQVVRQQRHDRAMEAVNNAKTAEERAAAQEQLTQAENDLFELYQVNQNAGTANARGLNARRLMVNQDFTLARMLNEYRAKVNDGQPLTETQRIEITSLHEQLAAKDKQISDLNDRISRQNAQTEFRVLMSQTKKQARTAAKEKRTFVDFMEDQAQAARERIIARRGRLQATIDPLNIAGLVDEAIIGASYVAKGIRNFADWSKRMLADFGDRIRPALRPLFDQSVAQADQANTEFSAATNPTPEQVLSQVQAGSEINPRVIFDLARAHVNQGMTELDDVMRAVTTELQARDPELTERQVRDAFSGYGKTTFPSKAEDLTRLRELRNLARLTSQLEDAQRGIVPLKTGPQRDKATARVRELQKQVNDKIREMGLQTRDPQTQLASSLQAAKTRIRNEIEELDRKIKAGDYTERPKRQPQTDRERTDLEFERSKLREQYNKGLIEARMAKRSTGRKVIDTGQEILNASRALLTSADLSAVLRQGGFIGLGNPVRAARALPDMFRAMASERAQFRVMEEIASRPNAPLYEQGKLYLAKEGNSLNELEEAFMSRWAQKIPGVRASQRAYNTFLNKLRADTFDSMVEGLRAGTPEEIRAIANYINAATGRGKLGLKSLENNAAALNTFFFAPRFVASRFQMLAGQPLYGGSARTRKLIATEYAKYMAGVSVVMALGLAAGATVESDPRSSLFGKLKFGNTLLDPLSGLAQNTTLVSRLASGETKTIRGKVVPIRGERIPFGSGDSATVIGRFLRTKLSPSVGAGFDLATGRNVIGEPVTPADVAVRAVVPISFQEILTTMEQQGVPRGTALTVLSLFGMGLQNLEQRR